MSFPHHLHNSLIQLKKSQKIVFPIHRIQDSYLDLSDRISLSDERGLLSLAFHPRFSRNCRLFVLYTGIQGDVIVSEFRARRRRALKVRNATERILLQVEHRSFANHNGGTVAFGKDGKLYASIGDGGGGGDPLGSGQNLGTLLGKIVRIDVGRDNRPSSKYTIPDDNPFVSTPGALPEIWAYGLRNPYRFSFDRRNGRLFAGDVGQDAREEVDIIRPGRNYGWNMKEGSLCFSPPSECNSDGLSDPIIEYGRSEGQSITGGYVYRGKNLSSLKGQYLFADFVTGTIWSARRESGGTWTRSELLSSGRNISSFGEDTGGELYVVDYGGEVLAIN
ncbi:MAG: glucose dehydrogenase [Proteobacteria bacterium]|nr:MAG: glucose dehydrogenase [Pseudomonadota bacterium]